MNQDTIPFSNNYIEDANSPTGSSGNYPNGTYSYLGDYYMLGFYRWLGYENTYADGGWVPSGQWSQTPGPDIFISVSYTHLTLPTKA